jgi:hypothetical protein
MLLGSSFPSLKRVSAIIIVAENLMILISKLVIELIDINKIAITTAKYKPFLLSLDNRNILTNNKNK